MGGGGGRGLRGGRRSRCAYVRLPHEQYFTIRGWSSGVDRNLFEGGGVVKTAGLDEQIVRFNAHNLFHCC